MIRKLKEIPRRMQIIHHDKKTPLPKLGDIFAFSIKEGEYMFGRVVADNPTVHGMQHEKSHHIVIYIYRGVSRDIKEFPSMNKKDLLLPPLIFPGDYWMLGYFLNVGNEPINENNATFPICFSADFMVDRWRDHLNNIIPKKVEPCGLGALTNIFGFEKEVCKALGNPIN